MQAASAAGVLRALAESMARNIRDRKGVNARRLRVGRCFGFRTIVPVDASRTTRWLLSEWSTIISREVPGSAM